MPGWINVPVRVETRDRLEALKRAGQSYDSLINEIVDAFPPKPIETDSVEDGGKGND